jgi:hypothetical protein
MFIDTGAGGIRIHPGNVKDSDIVHTGATNQIMYGDGNTGIRGEVLLGKVKIGDFSVPGNTPFQAILEKICKPGYEEKCKREGSKHGGAGTIGLGTFHPAELGKHKRKEAPVFNPLIQQGPFAFILKVPRQDGDQGSLIINPREEEKSRFIPIALKPGKGKAIPVCINRHCFDAALDTGTVGNKIPVVTDRDIKLLGLPVEDDEIAPGTKVPVVIGSGRNSLTVELEASARGPGRFNLKEKNKERGVIGIDIFRYIDVLYDFNAGVIGVAKKDES